MKINLLDSALGIENILSNSQQEELPKARSLVFSVFKEDGLEELYTSKNYGQQIEEALCPLTGDGEILRPEVFSQNLFSCLEKIKQSESVVNLHNVEEDLEILLENKELLRRYCGLMIGG